MRTSFQSRVRDWLLACFGWKISDDKVERNHRFLEEAIELVQSLGATASECHQLVDYVFSRPVGDPFQEAGGTIVTLSALCSANQLVMDECAEAELSRIWTKVEQIREKQKNKPKHSPLPAAPSGINAPTIEWVKANDYSGVTTVGGLLCKDEHESHGVEAENSTEGEVAAEGEVRSEADAAEDKVAAEVRDGVAEAAQEAEAEA